MFSAASQIFEIDTITEIKATVDNTETTNGRSSQGRGAANTTRKTNTIADERNGGSIRKTKNLSSVGLRFGFISIAKSTVFATNHDEPASAKSEATNNPKIMAQTLREMQCIMDYSENLRETPSWNGFDHLAPAFRRGQLTHWILVPQSIIAPYIVNDISRR